MLAIPAVGSDVVVSVRAKDYYYWAKERDVVRKYEGTVVASDPLDPPSSFRLFTGNQFWPTSMIMMRSVCMVLYKTGEASAQKPIETEHSYKVAGSKGAIYIVRVKNGTWSCTCPQNQIRRATCKHIQEMKSKQKLD